MYSSKIIQKIDELIADSSLTDNRFQPRFTAGLVQQIPVQSKTDASRILFIPAKLNGLNDATQVIPDDNFNLITYHRLISNTYQPQQGRQQFGDTYDFELCTSDIIMIIIGFYNKLNLTAEKLEALISSNFPDILEREFTSDLQMNTIIVQKSSSNFDAVQIFRQEYGGESHFIDKNIDMSIFQIRYKIEASYKKGCIKICDPC